MGRAAEPIKQHWQAHYQCQQRDQRRQAAERGGKPARAPERSWPRGAIPRDPTAGWIARPARLLGASCHDPGPVTPATSVAVADSVTVNELIPISESTFVG